jgi:hypothetical protein
MTEVVNRGVISELGLDHSSHRVTWRGNFADRLTA